MRIVKCPLCKAAPDLLALLERHFGAVIEAWYSDEAEASYDDHFYAGEMGLTAGDIREIAAAIAAAKGEMAAMREVGR